MNAISLRRLAVRILASGFVVAIVSCAPSTAHISAVTGFDLSRYTGRWYEIARLPNRFEAGLDSVTAEYSVNSHGGVRVVNRGYKTAEEEWKEAVGKARFVGDSTVGALEVSFFGPFYAGYKIVRLDSDYRWAVVTSSRMNYLWLLARTPRVADTTRTAFVAYADSLGFAVEELIYPAQPDQ